MATASIYVLIDPFTKEVRYVGKANNPAERLKGHIRDSGRHMRPVCRWVASLLKMGAAPIMEILFEGVENWQDVEVAAIKRYRELGARLLNLADGGDHLWCSPGTRERNAIKNAKSRNRYVWLLKRDIGEALKWLKDNDRPLSIIAKVEKAQRYLQSIPREAHEAFAEMHAARCAANRGQIGSKEVVCAEVNR